MPGFLLHLGAAVLCAHGGQAQPMTTNPRVTVNGQPIVMLTSAYSITACTLPPPVAGNGPCVTAQWLSAATRVLANGQAVLLQDSQALCAPTGTPLLITMTQPRVSGM